MDYCCITTPIDGVNDVASGTPSQITSAYVPGPCATAWRPHGARNKMDKLKDRFIWPGMEIQEFWQQYPQCQCTAPKKPVPVPLIPLPIVSIPLERICMDLIGPLPKSAWVHEYILVLVDYAT